ncbi:MAG: DoxX family protein [Actinobacteria bacterium]|nr:MAG: DoxX family protein [Actinomycetota bacterium]
MEYGMILLRVVAGLALAAHGSQKLFGSFGGSGPAGTRKFFAGLGFRTPLAMAFIAGLSELGGGLLFAFGLLTPFAALAITIVMLNAIATVHWKKGFFNSAGGFEYNLLIIAAALAITANGPGRFSLDYVVGWAGDLSGPWLALAVAIVAAALATLTLTVGRGSQVPVSTKTSTAVPS